MRKENECIVDNDSRKKGCGEKARKRREPGLKRNPFCTFPILIVSHSEALSHLLLRFQPVCPGCLLLRLVGGKSTGTIPHTVSGMQDSRACVDLAESVWKGGGTFGENILHDGGLRRITVQCIV